MSHFWVRHDGEALKIILSLMTKGRIYYSTIDGRECGLRFDYPVYGDLDELETVSLGVDQLDDMYEDVRSMLYQKLQLNSERYSLTYT